MRSRPEWIGRTDNSAPPARVKQRIIERQNNTCALTGRAFRPGDKIEFDHRWPICLGGPNRESNLQAVLAEAHQRKTATEAYVKAKVMRVRKKHLGLKPKAKWPFAHLKRKLDGTVVNRRTGEAV